MKPTDAQEELANDMVAEVIAEDKQSGCTCDPKSCIEFDHEGNPTLIQVTHNEDCELELDTDASCSWN